MKTITKKPSLLFALLRISVFIAITSNCSNDNSTSGDSNLNSTGARVRLVMDKNKDQVCTLNFPDFGNVSITKSPISDESWQHWQLDAEVFKDSLSIELRQIDNEYYKRLQNAAFYTGSAPVDLGKLVRSIEDVTTVRGVDFSGDETYFLGKVPGNEEQYLLLTFQRNGTFISMEYLVEGYVITRQQEDWKIEVSNEGSALRCDDLPAQ